MIVTYWLIYAITKADTMPQKVIKKNTGHPLPDNSILSPNDWEDRGKRMFDCSRRQLWWDVRILQKTFRFPQESVNKCAGSGVSYYFVTWQSFSVATFDILWIKLVTCPCITKQGLIHHNVKKKKTAEVNLLCARNISITNTITNFIIYSKTR